VCVVTNDALVHALAQLLHLRRGATAQQTRRETCTDAGTRAGRQGSAGEVPSEQRQEAPDGRVNGGSEAHLFGSQSTQNGNRQKPLDRTTRKHVADGSVERFCLFRFTDSYL